MNYSVKNALAMAQLYRKNWDNPDEAALNQIVADICTLAEFEGLDRAKLLQQLKLR